jgi:Asp/Glu/hydantoin racemase
MFKIIFIVLYNIEYKICGYGLSSRLTSVHNVGIPIIELADAWKADIGLWRRCQWAVEGDGAEAIAPGCTGIALVEGYLNEVLDIPVVESSVATIKLTESLLQSSRSRNKRCFPRLAVMEGG